MSILETTISYYEKPSQTEEQLTVPIGYLFKAIQNGKYKDNANHVRKAKDKEKKATLKKDLPCFTISGRFPVRGNQNISTHSGMIALDVDNLPPEELQRARRSCINDKHTVCVFTSVGGEGLCVIFRMKPTLNKDEHTDTWHAIDVYLKQKYNILVDPSAKDISRLRFVSYDPDIYINENAIEFIPIDLQPKRGRPKALKAIPTTNDDYEHVLRQIADKRINLAESYSEWRDMAWALIDGLGSGNARDAFHVVSSYSSKYDPKNTDQYFDRFVNSYDSSNPRAITKATFFARAKEHGLSIQSEKTKRVITAVKAATSSKKTRHQAVAEITATEEISESEAHSITDAVYDARNEFHDESTPEDAIEHVLSTYGKFEYNEITRKIEITNMDLQRASMNDTIFNDVFIFTRKSIPKKPPSDRMVQAIIHSSYSTPYNPIKEFLHASKPKHKGKTDAIRAIADSLITEDRNTEKTFRYIKKWLVATARMWDTGEPNPYMCIIIGKQQGTGKTTFFRRLIPSQITPYYSETRLSGSKDDLILATEKAVILVDELAGLHKTDWDFIKQMLTQKIITARPSYGRYAVDLPRIAAWAGTSNQTELLRDESNRRFLVLNVLDINREKYNAVEKSDLFAEAYFLHLAGEDRNETIDEYNDLSEDADKYRITTLEETLIEQHYIHPDVAREVMDISKINPRNVKNSAEIIEEINKKTNFSHKLNSRLIGSALNRLNFPKIDGRSYRKNRYCWLVFERSDNFMDA